MNKGFLALAFAAGAAIGSAVTWKVLKDKYEQLVQEEIESVKDAYARYYGSRDAEESVDTDESVEEADEEDPIDAEEQAEYEDIIHSQGYASHSKPVVNEEPAHYEVIPPDEVGIEDDYEVITWYHFADGFVTDQNEEIVPDWEVLVGPDVDEHFGEYEDDSVYVRNDATKSYYEILKDNRKYMHVRKAHAVDQYRGFSEDE